mmetsp:Transcript_29641/g.72079  ORF Transcript_29641/g.72079 Transcript_29641/m.72079 type:complete len:248 (-) Transcript_29641:73-816(-)
MHLKSLKQPETILTSWWSREASPADSSPDVALKQSGSESSLLSVSSLVSYEDSATQEDTLVIKAKRKSFEADDDDLYGEDIVTLYVRVLEDWCSEEEPDLPAPREKASLFFSVRKPGIPIEFYVRRLINNCYCSRSVFIVALMYLDRLAKFDGRLKLSEYNLHRMLITAILLAAKFIDDTHYSNAHFARVGGVPSIPELNKLELAMLSFLSFDLNVNPDDFDELVKGMKDIHAVAPLVRGLQDRLCR